MSEVGSHATGDRPGRAAAVDRRTFVGALVAAPVLASCGSEVPYAEEDRARLAAQMRTDRERSGQGPYGAQLYRGYRGLAELPWFELDERGRLVCTVADLPPVIDIHAHLGISLGVAPDVDLTRRTPRVRYMLDCDGREPPCELDLDVYINGNFTRRDLWALRWEALSGFLWGGSAAATHTIPNLLEEMDAVRVERALILPIAFGLPFGDDLTERWLTALSSPEARERLIPGASVHPQDPACIEKLRGYAAQGARAIKVHPTMQRVFPDAPEAMEIYKACRELGMVVLFHAGRAGIEPESSQPYALPRHYEAALREFPDVAFVLGHAGARDVEGMVAVARRHPNAWLDVHGQGVTVLGEMIHTLGTERLLFGTDWPFYPLAATLAKVLIVTEGRPALRDAILRHNAARLLGLEA
jgi:predicted TIM-barrel fold metal-dependent hydrolase